MLGFFKKLFGTSKVYTCIGPNTFAELVKQFDQPPKVKTQEDKIRDYCIQVAMYQYELEMLRMERTQFYMGCTRTFNTDKTQSIDFVPCSVRPDVVYCSYGKN